MCRRARSTVQWEMFTQRAIRITGLTRRTGKSWRRQLPSALSKIDPSNAAYYAANLRKFNERLDAKLEEWSKAMEPLRGTQVITYHKSFDYFLECFGLELVGHIGPKPGIEPSPTHINSLIPRAKEAGVKLVLIEVNRNRAHPGISGRSHRCESRGAAGDGGRKRKGDGLHQIVRFLCRGT